MVVVKKASPVPLLCNVRSTRRFHLTVDTFSLAICLCACEHRFANGAGSYGGGWRLGCKHGIGKRIFASGAEYEGEYKDDMMCGRGVYKSSIGDLYVGE